MMRSSFLYLIIITLFLPAASSAQPQWCLSLWPTSIDTNLALAPYYPDSFAVQPHALPYPDGSTLVVFRYTSWGNVYQIIDRYGQLKYPTPQSVWPAVSGVGTTGLKVIPDGEGGALIWWYVYPPYGQGICAQRLDSLGNICWGDSGITIHPESEADNDICIDGDGEFFLVIGTEGNIIAQRIDRFGNILWGEEGRIVCDNSYQQNWPNITYDSYGGAYAVWMDYRPPHTVPDGAVFMQRLDAGGNPMWAPNGIFVSEYEWMYDIVPDGQGGVILHNGAGGANGIHRIDPSGNILWSREIVSWYNSARIVCGEPGFFYLGFTFEDNVYGQRIDINGRLYWTEYPGAEMVDLEGMICGWHLDFAYRYPYFYGISDFQYPDNPFFHPRDLYIQALDSAGHRMFGEEGTHIACIDTMEAVQFDYTNVAPDDQGGAVGVWWKKKNSGPVVYEVYAKHVNTDGTLGGPDPRKRPMENYPQISGTSSGEICFDLAEAGLVKLDLFDLLGRKVRTIEERYFGAGNYTVYFDQSDLVSGMYFVRLGAPCGQAVKKVLVVR